ncbi:hypothetical protein CEP52_015469 [Fusarium oligoseptatum]|uniref:ABM domain-containing protein n=1 Tax=Fusarium oligoseptatum TaxID=2604345 RepID=A0A428SD29_9HYPO|nr:hypothetical protein CEP52_015469 [Fusarium oligoseptatum]
MSTCAEITVFRLQEAAAVQVLDRSTELGQSFFDAIQVIQGILGAQKVHYSLSIERPDELWLFVDWKSEESCKNKLASEGVKTILQPFLKDKAPSSNHTFHVSPSPYHVLNDPTAPIIEIFRIFFPADTTDADLEAIHAHWKKCSTLAIYSGGIAKAAAWGWTKEREVPHPDGESDPGFHLVVLVTWESLARHLENNDTEGFKESAKIFHDMPRLVGYDMMHINGLLPEA